MKKITMALGTIITIAAPAATAISCSSGVPSNPSKTWVPAKPKKIVVTDGQKLQEGYDYLEEYKEALVMEKPSFVTGVTPQNVLLKVFGIKSLPKQLKDITFSDIQVTPTDSTGKLSVQIKMHLNKEIKDFDKTITSFYTTDQKDRKDILDLSEFRFKTDIQEDVTSWYEYIPLATVENYKQTLGFDIYDSKKTFRGKTYQEWFKGLELVGFKDLNEISFDNEAPFHVFPARLDYTRVSDTSFKNNRNNMAWEDDSKGVENHGYYAVEFTFKKGNVTESIRVNMMGWLKDDGILQLRHQNTTIHA